MKLVVEEPESEALTAYLESTPHLLTVSRIALVEAHRAVAIANPSTEARAEAKRLLNSCLLVDVGDSLLRAAARLTSREVRTLDAVHLASAQRVGADEVLAYDRRLADAARDEGFPLMQPAAPP